MRHKLMLRWYGIVHTLIHSAAFLYVKKIFKNPILYNYQ